MPDNYYFKLSMFESVKEAESRLIQDTAFENGWRWVGTGERYFKVTSPCLAFEPNFKCMSQGFESDGARSFTLIPYRR